jgi:UDPglucose 6-dehydrogenase
MTPPGDVQTIAVVGLGHLGAPMVACFASKGFDVIGVDIDETKAAAIASGSAPVREPGLPELLAANQARIRTTTDLGAAVRQADMTFIVVATPSEDDGTFSLRYVLAACETIGDAIASMDRFHTVVLTSTVMPGSTDGRVRETLEESSGGRCGESFGLCYSPEFIALGSVIRDFLAPDFLLVGESDPRAGAMLETVYRQTVETVVPVARMSIVNAELTKIAVNTFVTTKIAFANMVAGICERLPGADVDVVTAALGLDTRIGSKYLRGAISYGGPCFPRDNSAFAALANRVGAPAFIAEATDRQNQAGIAQLASLVRDRLPHGGIAAILGLSYKPDTDVVAAAPGLLVAQILAESGIEVVAYDPVALTNAERVLGSSIRYGQSAADCVAQADVVVITTAWREFAAIQVETFASPAEGRPKVVLDCWRMLDRDALEKVADYVVLGEGQLVVRGVPTVGEV